MPLKGKHVLITVSSRGIGRGIALKLAEQGVKVTINYCRNEVAAKYQEKTMNDMADPQIIQKVNALIQKNDEALNKNDAAAYFDFVIFGLNFFRVLAT